MLRIRKTPIDSAAPKNRYCNKIKFRNVHRQIGHPIKRDQKV